MNETNADLIASMARVNGRTLIMKKLVEESGELIAAISRGGVDGIVEELVDTEIMIKQMLWVLPPGALSLREKVMGEKMERIRGLIQDHELSLREQINAPMMNHEPSDLDDVNG